MKDYLEIVCKGIDKFWTIMYKSSNPETFSVEWGDGETEVFESAKGMVQIGHEYKTKGTYTIRFNIKDVTLDEQAYDGTRVKFLNLKGCNIISVSGSLPAMKLTPKCYNSMFENNQISDISNFVLPATKLANSCYSGMFANNKIKDLKGFKLLGTELHNWCYSGMFAELIS